MVFDCLFQPDLEVKIINEFLLLTETNEANPMFGSHIISYSFLTSIIRDSIKENKKII